MLENSEHYEKNETLHKIDYSVADILNQVLSAKQSLPTGVTEVYYFATDATPDGE